jgi:hypothetical protein
MKSTLSAIVLFITVLSCDAQNKKSLRFDGLYQTTAEDGIVRYLRFYANGVVLDVVTTENGDAKDVIKWLNKNTPGWYGKGTWENHSGRLYFTTTCTNGTLVYEGIIVSEYNLKLHLKSLINSGATSPTYYFIKISK